MKDDFGAYFNEIRLGRNCKCVLGEDEVKDMNKIYVKSVSYDTGVLIPVELLSFVDSLELVELPSYTNSHEYRMSKFKSTVTLISKADINRDDPEAARKLREEQIKELKLQIEELEHQDSSI